MRPRISLVPAAASLLVALLLALPAGASARAFFGVSAAEPPTTRDLDAMARARAGTIRFTIPWANMEPSPGALDFSQIDPVVAGAASAGLQLLPTLYASPSWAVDCGLAPAGECATVSPTSSTTGTRAWREFVNAVVGRYGPSGTFWSDPSDAFDPPRRPIRRWQIWNEVNSPEFFQPKQSPRAYGRLLSDSADAIHTVDPSARIYLAGLFGTPPKPGISAWKFLSGIRHLKSVRGDYDVAAIHPYSPGLKGIFYQLSRARKAIGRKTPLAVTELGWSSGSPAQGVLFRGPAGQAKSLRTAFRALRRGRRRYKLESIFWFSWRDLPGEIAGPCTFCGSAGLLQNDYGTKPSLSAFTAFTGGRP